MTPRFPFASPFPRVRLNVSPGRVAWQWLMRLPRQFGDKQPYHFFIAEHATVERKTARRSETRIFGLTALGEARDCGFA